MNNNLYKLIMQALSLIVLTILAYFNKIDNNSVIMLFGIIIGYLFRNKDEIVKDITKKE